MDEDNGVEGVRRAPMAGSSLPDSFLLSLVWMLPGDELAARFPAKAPLKLLDATSRPNAHIGSEDVLVDVEISALQSGKLGQSDHKRSTALRIGGATPSADAC